MFSQRARSYAKFGLLLYLAITLLIVAYALISKKADGYKSLYWILKPGPHSTLSWTLLYVTLAWLLLGSVLFLLYRNYINNDNVIRVVLFYLCAFIYLIFLRERSVYGDVWDYIHAAQNLYSGQPLGLRYPYPPFWATCLQPFVPLGQDALVMICLAANYLSLLLLFFLLFNALVLYGFSKNLSAFWTFFLFCASTPILRTLCYVQVNLHVANLILLSLLLYSRHLFFSALALCLAIHLKSSPAVLVLPFLLMRNWKWILYFALSMLGVVVFTSLMNDPGYYGDYLKNIRDLSSRFCFRQNSMDSFVNATLVYLQVKPSLGVYIIWPAKVLLLLIGLILMGKSAKNRTFYTGLKEKDFLLNSYIVLCFLMVGLSPYIWSHHLVFIIFPFAVLLKRLATPLDFVLYGITYFLLFLVPTFDFYPISYHRLLGVLLCFLLLYRLVRKSGQDRPSWFIKLNEKTDAPLVDGIRT